MRNDGRSKNLGYLMILIAFLSSLAGFITITWIASFAYLLVGDVTWLDEIVNKCIMDWKILSDRSSLD